MVTNAASRCSGAAPVSACSTSSSDTASPSLASQAICASNAAGVTLNGSRSTARTR
jgi:hypothetical protein